VTYGQGLLAILVPDATDGGLAASLDRMRQDFGDRAYLALTLRRRPGDAVRLRELAELAQAARVPTVVTGDVLHHVPQRRILQDVVTCILEGVTSSCGAVSRSSTPPAARPVRAKGKRPRQPTHRPPRPMA